MSASHPEVFVDHIRDLLAAKESVIFLRFPLLSKGTFFPKFDFLDDLFREVAIFAPSVSKFGICRPKIDRDVLRSSTDVARLDFFIPTHSICCV